MHKLLRNVEGRIDFAADGAVGDLGAPSGVAVCSLTSFGADVGR